MGDNDSKLGNLDLKTILLVIALGGNASQGIWAALPGRGTPAPDANTMGPPEDCTRRIDRYRKKIRQCSKALDDCELDIDFDDEDLDDPDY